MPASDKFERLGRQVDQAEANIKATASQNRDQVKAEVEAARKSADEQAQQLRANTQAASQRVESGWQQVQDDWNAHVQRIRESLDAKKAELDRRDAEGRVGRDRRRGRDRVRRRRHRGGRVRRPGCAARAHGR